MKWLKLDCDFRNDPKIQALAREWGGQEAAGFWCLLLGFVGAHGGSECKVKIDPASEFNDQYLASWFSSKAQVMFARLTRAAQLSLICATEWENNRVIFIPKMLKRVDDYTRKVRTNSQQSPKLPHTEEETEEEREKEKQLRRRLEAGFEKLWDKYPSKDGRKQAEKHFWASVKTDEDLIAIQKALQNYLVHLANTDWKRPKNGSTWFNNWRDFVEWKEPEKAKVAPLWRE